VKFPEGNHTGFFSRNSREKSGDSREKSGFVMQKQQLELLLLSLSRRSTGIRLPLAM
jgi:hypothetical protein